MASKIIHSENRCFLWKIKNFHTLLTLSGEAICSPKFSIERQGLVNFSVYLYPRGEELLDDGEFLSVFLVRDFYDHGPKEMFIDFKITICDSQKVPTAYSYSETGYFERGFKYGCRKFVPRQTSFEAITELLRNDFYILCEFALMGDEDGETYSPWVAEEGDLKRLSSDFGSAFEDGKYCDLFLRSSDDVVFRTHKAVVFGRFPEITESLESPETLESNGDEISIKMNACTLHALLQYLYTGKFKPESREALSYESLFDSKLPHLETLIFPPLSTAYATTVVQVKTLSLSWIIPLPRKVLNKKVLKNVFRFEENTVFVISLNIKENISDEDNVYFSLQALSSKKTLHIKCRIQFYDSSHKLLPVIPDFWGEHHFVSDEPWTIPLAIPAIILKNESNIFPDWKMRVTFKFELSYGELQTQNNVFHISTIDDEEWKVNFWALQNDFRNIFGDSSYSDVVIRIREKTFHAHRFVLSARSSVFSKLLSDHNYKNRKVTQLAFNNIDHATVDALLSYLYCGGIIKTPESIKYAVKLYAAAERFDLDPLKHKCILYIKNNLKADNVQKILPLVSKNEYLLEIVKHYMSGNAYEILYFLEISEKGNISPCVQNIIKEIPSEVLMTVIIYMISGKLPGEKIDVPSIIKLYEYACKHHLHKIKQASISLAFQELKPENIGQLFILGLKYNDEYIRSKLNAFVSFNTGVIIQSIEWKKVMEKRRDLATDMKIINSFSKVLSPDIVFDMLTYIHCGKLWEEGRSVRSLASLYFNTLEYKFLLLRKRYATLIRNRITPQNVGNIAVIAQKYNDGVLTECIVDFISTNYQSILDSFEWRKSVGKLKLHVESLVIKAAPHELKFKIIMIVLTYIYSGLPDYNQTDLDLLLNLYTDASKHELKQIRKSCSLCLKQAINAENVGKILMLAYRHEDKELENLVKIYVSSNIERIVKSSEFESKITKKIESCVYSQILGTPLKYFNCDEIISMLTYLYTEDLEKQNFDLDRVIKMYICANKYKIHQMKNKCNLFFKRIISTKNVGTFIKLSDKCNDDTLECYTKIFVILNKCKILKLHDWTAVEEKSLPSLIVFGILWYVHTGKINKKQSDIKSLMKLYTFAQKNNLLGLKDESFRLLKNKIKVENLGDILNFAAINEDKLLESYALNFVSEHMNEILSSDYWAKLIKIRTDTSGSLKNVAVATKKYGPEILKNTLTYIFYGRLTDGYDLDTLVKLYTASNRHQLGYLKDMCLDNIKRDLTSKNIGRILIAADANNDDCLKQTAYDFVCSNAKELLNSSEWKETLNEHPKIAVDVLKAVLTTLA